MNADTEYPIVKVDPAWVIDEEPMGSKNKRWVRRPGDAQPWLFKFSRTSAGQITGEHWAEKLGAEAAELLQVPHAPVELARYEGAWGSLSRQFDALANPRTELVHGNDLLAGHVTGYDRHKQHRQSDHTVANILAALGSLFGDAAEKAAAQSQLAGCLLLDALIVNTDRHHENWAVLRTTHADRPVSHRVAPSFDHASSLGRNEPPAKLAQWLAEPWRVKWYADRAHGGVYISARDAKGASPVRLAEVLARRWPWAIAAWRPVIAGLHDGQLAAIVARLPADAIAAESKAFCTALLSHTLARLKAL